MDEAEARRRLEMARVGRFASITPSGRPHVVAVTYALLGEHVVHMVDQKPKTSRDLQRVRNVEAVPFGSLLVDHYDDDWSALWWVRIDGAVEVAEDGDRWSSARTTLGKKYEQYRISPPEGPAVFLAVDRVSYWEGS